MTNKKQHVLLKPRSVGRMQEFLNNVKQMLEEDLEITIIGDNLTINKIQDFCKFPINWKNPLSKGKPVRNTFVIKKK
jgi:hypothetical protein